MTESLDQQNSDLVQATDRLLWHAYQSAINNTPQPGQLTFPLKSNSKIRVSEQEAKQILIGILNNSPFSYSVETPTFGTYSFSGEGERSAATDLTLYGPDAQRYMNFEFKAGNFSTKRRNLKMITKDIKKLILEEVNGFWFHTLEATRRDSVASLWQTIRQELKAVVQEVGVEFSPKLLTFHCCILQQKFSVQTTLKLDRNSCSTDWLMGVDVPSFQVKGGQLIEIQNADGWIVNRQVPERHAVTTEALK